MSRPEILSDNGGSSAGYANPMDKGFAEQLELDKRFVHSQER